VRITEPLDRTTVRVLDDAISKLEKKKVELTVIDDWSQQRPSRAGIYVTIRRELPRVAWARQLHELKINNDGFAIVHGATGTGTIWLVADAPRGLLYGAYELLHSYGISETSTAGVLVGTKKLLRDEISSPAFKRRLVGTGYWEFLSEKAIRQWLEALSRQRVNGFVAFMSLNNYADLKPFKDLWGEPFGHLLVFRDYPELRWEERHRDLIVSSTQHLNRLIDIAGEFGIEVYLGTWEIGYPNKILEAYPELAQPTPMSVSNPATERYIRSRFRELAKRFPRIKGIIYNGVESHSYVMKSETLSDGRVISRAERRARFTKWATEALREVIPDAVLVTLNGPIDEVKASYQSGTIYLTDIIGDVYSDSSRPQSKVLSNMGPMLSPVPQGVRMDETNEYRAQNAITVANIYGWSSRIGPTYEQGAFDEMLLCYSRSIPGLNPSGAYGLDVLNLHSFGSPGIRSKSPTRCCVGGPAVISRMLRK
jgi:hypothetical protein